VVIGASFDSVNEQKKFDDEQSFGYTLISDPTRSIGGDYFAVRQEGERFAEYGLPRRISYLINPEGKVAKVYLVEADGLDLDAHASAVLDDIRAAG
jgi:peroxiredoxin